jgi:hypothetical protein
MKIHIAIECPDDLDALRTALHAVRRWEQHDPAGRHLQMMILAKTLNSAEIHSVLSSLDPPLDVVVVPSDGWVS